MTQNTIRQFVVYFDDNDSKVTAYVEILELNQAFVRFSNGKNIITLPISRILKIKESQND